MKIKMKNILKILFLYCISVIFTIPKLFLISLKKKESFNLIYGLEKSKRIENYYRVSLDFNSDLIWDPNIPLPFLEKKIDTIYSIHFLDKLKLIHIERHLKFCRNNLLKHNGRYIFSVKNSEPYFKSYINKRISLFNKLDNIDHEYQESYFFQINNVAYSEGNKTMFDKEFIKAIFIKNGFNIKEREFNFTFDNPNKYYDSIYFVAHK
tara:strand:+ start:17 stop:640 length:624 start_codon:yes stop_codon:yes gene_type:complete